MIQAGPQKRSAAIDLEGGQSVAAANHNFAGAVPVGVDDQQLVTRGGRCHAVLALPHLFGGAVAGHGYCGGRG